MTMIFIFLNLISMVDTISGKNILELFKQSIRFESLMQSRKPQYEEELKKNIINIDGTPVSKKSIVYDNVTNQVELERLNKDEKIEIFNKYKTTYYEKNKNLETAISNLEQIKETEENLKRERMAYLEKKRNEKFYKFDSGNQQSTLLGGRIYGVSN